MVSHKSDHSSTIVPIEAWCYHSPRLRYNGTAIDVGLVAEALVYYDRVFVQPTNELQFASFISWFRRQSKYEDLIALIKDGTLNFYSYSFIVAPVYHAHTGRYIILNMQDEEQAKSNVFESRYLSYKNLHRVLPHARQREKLQKVIAGRVIEVKADDFGTAVQNARRDYEDPVNSALLVQAFIDDASQWRPIAIDSEVTAKIVKNADGSVNITWNVNFDNLAKVVGKDVNFHRGAPLAGAAHCNRLIWSSARQRCDLYLSSPMSALVGNKLYESGLRTKTPQTVIETLIGEVEFPNIRDLINQQQIGLEEVLSLRKKGSRFRKWLQEESEHDRNALFAYHNEVAKEAGWTQIGRRTVKLFGVLGGAVAGAAAAGPEGAAVGALAGEGVKYLLELVSELGEGWKPVVFGDWAKGKISKALEEKR